MCGHGAQFAIILLTCLAVVHATEFVCVEDGHCFNKCCPRGFALNYNIDDYSAEPVCWSANITENGLTSSEVQGHDGDLLRRNCSEVFVSGEDPWPLCVDRLASNQSTIVRVSCKVPLKSNVRFKKCCKQGYKYDFRLHTCLPEDSTEFDVHDFLENSTVVDAVIHGIPDCDGVLVDFTLANASRISEVEMESGNVCVDRIFKSDDLIGGRRCKNTTEVCSKIPCIRKCCPPGKHFYGRNCSTTDTDRGFNLTFYRLTNLQEHEIADAPPIYGIIHVPEKDRSLSKFRLNPKAENDTSYLLTNGSLHAPRQRNKILNHVDYCLEDIFSKSNTGQTNTFIYFRIKDQEIVPNYGSRYVIVAAGLILSCIFLLATLIVYLCLPALQNIHGMTLMCHVASFLVAYVCLATAQIDRRYNKLGVHWGCITQGFVLLFGFLASFAWMNIMCFDIWWTFGGVRSVQHVSRKTRERKRFAWYSLYAWGVPVAITALALFVEFTDNLPGWIIRPSIGTKSCWFPPNGFWSKMVYFVIPIGIQISCNIVLFVLTARSCSKVKAEINRMQKSSDDRSKKKFQADKNKLMMNGKLFVVMGITWVIELLGLLFPEIPPMWWAIADVLNALQGVFIFVIFVMKRKVLHALAARFGCPIEKKQTAKTNALLGSNVDARKGSMSSSCFTNTTTLQVTT